MKVLACWALALVLGLALGAVVKDSPVVKDDPKPVVKDSPAAKPSGTTPGPAAVVKETVPEDCEANVCNTRKVTCIPIQQNCTAGTMSRDFGAGYCGCCPACVQLRGKGERCLENDDYQEYTTAKEQVPHPGLCKSPLKCTKGKCA